MKLAWATDVHLNFVESADFDAFCDLVVDSGCDALLVTGDIAEAPSLERYVDRLADAIAKPVYFVLGNHDYYRSGVHELRDRMLARERESHAARWLGAGMVVPLGRHAALVGHDGWGDARAGDYARSPVRLSDFELVRDLTGIDADERRARLQALGDESAAYFRELLPRVLENYETVVVATHVPPFREACWHEGRISGPYWLPHFTCVAVGDVLLEMARAHPNRSMLVLCGHTHGGGVFHAAPNLEVRTGEASYGSPAVQSVLAFE